MSAADRLNGFTLYIARHGQTEANAVGRLQGRSDTPLTALGREQAALVGRTMAPYLQQHPDIRFVSSPLPRTRATMEILLDAAGRPRHGYDIDARIIEMDIGDWSGLTREEAEARDPAFYARREADKWTIPIPGGESYQMVAARAEAFLADLDADTFAVSHGGFGRILRGLYEGLHWRDMSVAPEPQDCAFRLCRGTVGRIDPEYR